PFIPKDGLIQITHTSGGPTAARLTAPDPTDSEAAESAGFRCAYAGLSSLPRRRASCPADPTLAGFRCGERRLFRRRRADIAPERVYLRGDQLLLGDELLVQGPEFAQPLAHQNQLRLDVGLCLAQQLSPTGGIVGLAELAPDLGTSGLGLDELRKLLERQA